MQNKTVNIVCGILIIAALICFGYIACSSIFSKKEEKPKEEIEVIETVETDDNGRTERGQNVNLGSRIALPVKALINYSEIYSNSIMNNLDDRALSDETKTLIALDKIYKTAEFNGYLRYSEEYNSTYILPEEMDVVLKSIFKDSTVNRVGVDEILIYDQNTNTYVIVPHGYPTGSIEYTYEVPYKITTYPDRLELLAYRVYATKTIEMQEINTTQKVDLFYNKEKTSVAFVINNDPEFTDNTQLDYILKKINGGVIDANQLSQVKYTFEKVDDEYRISKFEKVSKTVNTQPDTENEK